MELANCYLSAKLEHGPWQVRYRCIACCHLFMREARFLGASEFAHATKSNERKLKEIRREMEKKEGG
jgi:hypothetical protein